MAPEHEPDTAEPDDVDLDEFADRSGPDPAREPGIDPATGEDEDPDADVAPGAEGEPPPP
jgi:hypothetical protein